MSEELQMEMAPVEAAPPPDVSGAEGQSNSEIPSRTRNRSAIRFPTKGVTIGGAVFCMVMVVTICLQPRHDALLCRSLLKADADRICETLANNGVSFSLRDNGSAIYVAKQKVHAARVEIVKSTPHRTEPMRFELVNFERPAVSTANATYTAALQNELEATIGAMKGVESARVLIETPGNAGRLNGERPLAAVIVSNAASAKLSSEQMEVIQNLVASSTDLLTPDEVTVSDSESLAELKATHYDH